MNYSYVAYNEDKKLIRGTVNVSSEEVAEKLLLRQGYQPIMVKPRAALPAVDELFPSLFSIKPKEVIMLSRQLATLMDAGINVVPALQLIGEEMSNRKFRRTIDEVLNDLRAGNPLSQALARQNGVFSDLYCQMMAVGERTGNVIESLRQAADHMEKDAIMKKKIKKALTYPAIVLTVGVLVISILMIFVLPEMIKMFTSMGTDLPVTTRMLIRFNDFIGVYKLQLITGLATIIFGAILYLKRPSGRYQLDRFLLKAPVLGKVNLMNEMARFSRTLSILVSAGLSLPEILAMAQRTSSNLLVKDALGNVRTGMLQGEGLSGPMSRNKVFPSLLVQMVMVGEESGRLESTLDTVAKSYEAEADERINGMISMIEPVMTMILALFTGFIALSVIAPMYSMSGSVQ